MNTFEYKWCLKNDVPVRLVFEKIVYETLLHFILSVWNDSKVTFHVFSFTWTNDTYKTSYLMLEDEWNSNTNKVIFVTAGYSLLSSLLCTLLLNDMTQSNILG